MIKVEELFIAPTATVLETLRKLVLIRKGCVNKILRLDYIFCFEKLLQLSFDMTHIPHRL